MILKMCECGATYPASATKCPHCGYDEDCPCCLLYGVPKEEDYGPVPELYL